MDSILDKVMITALMTCIVILVCLFLGAIVLTILHAETAQTAFAQCP